MIKSLHLIKGAIMSTSTTERFTFNTTGKFFTDKVKQFALSGSWSDAIDFMEESFEGLPMDDILKIIKGDMHIIGDSKDDSLESVNLSEEEKDFNYKKELQEVYVDNYFYENSGFYKYIRTFEVKDWIDFSVKENVDLVMIDYLKHSLTPKEIIEKYTLNKKMGDVLFEIKKDVYLIARKANKNSLPFWLKKTDYSQSATSYFEKLYPSAKKQNNVVEENKIQKPKVSTNSLYKTMKNSYIEEFAKNNGYTDVESYSDYLKNLVMQACVNQNVTWKNYSIIINGKSYERTVPVEIALAYTKNKNYKWLAVSPSGVKMENDSSIHTDLWLSMGFELSADAYLDDSLNYQIFYGIINLIEKEYNNDQDFVVLNAAGLQEFTGKIVFEYDKNITDKDILVLPNANMKYEKIARKAGLIIVENGSELSHLVIVGKGEMLPVLRMQNALNMFKDISKIKVDMINKKINLL